MPITTPVCPPEPEAASIKNAVDSIPEDVPGHGAGGHAGSLWMVLLPTPKTDTVNRETHRESGSLRIGLRTPCGSGEMHRGDQWKLMNVVMNVVGW